MEWVYIVIYINQKVIKKREKIKEKHDKDRKEIINTIKFSLFIIHVRLKVLIKWNIYLQNIILIQNYLLIYIKIDALLSKYI